MRIGELADRAGTTTRSLRYYEEQGLLPARRTANGYRDYDEDDLRAVNEIRSLLAIGFALEDTRPFVECLRAGNPTGDVCPASVAVYRRKLDELDDCIARLQAVRAQVAAAVERNTGEESCCKRSPTRTSRSGC
ncbi:MerR family transcriptional regulator [Kutzneria chonburiensis]|jgi:DNA-binding transcriptional MerR regulator|uniref:MerR family transcriptional regulator n=1 Tax=Kutzneria chonburiensis TaxID=1483604 RepID=A0ABV6N1P5_9PSEU|nr:MerR family transcriptional regulator [Kutzneria chonburiensis]